MAFTFRTPKLELALPAGRSRGRLPSRRLLNSSVENRLELIGSPTDKPPAPRGFNDLEAAISAVAALHDTREVRVVW